MKGAVLKKIRYANKVNYLNNLLAERSFDIFGSGSVDMRKDTGTDNRSLLINGYTLRDIYKGPKPIPQQG